MTSVAPHDRGLSSSNCAASASVTSCFDQGLALKTTTVNIKTTESQRDERGPPRPRPIIVRLCSERVRDVVFRSRTGLKDYNRQHQDHQIFLNEDLTAVRAKIFFEARQLKRRKKITDCWSSYGKIVVKDLQNKIIEIKFL